MQKPAEHIIITLLTKGDYMSNQQNNPYFIQEETTMQKVLNQLKNNTSCLDIKQYFQQGQYDLEGCVIELLDFLDMSGCQEYSSTKKDAIMVFLHE